MIHIKDLNKNYGKAKALIDLNLLIEEGEVFGFIGPNGAGKSTTMMILATLLAPTSGEAYVNGYNVLKEPHKVRQLIGYMPDFFGVYDNLKTVEYLDFYAGAYNIPENKRGKLITDLLELVNLSNKRDAYVDSLSRGMKQRLGLARCLIHNPQVLILDEPASGLDPRARIEMREILKELKRMKKTIMISSHILPELAEICDVIGVIEKGKMIAYGNVNEMALGMKGLQVLKIKVIGTSIDVLTLLNDNPNVKQVDHKNDHYRVLFSGSEEDKVGLLSFLIQHELPIVHFGTENENLEDVFLTITEGMGS